ncbi:MAG TPA: ABC transporter permease [Lacipirellula sp.]
MTTAPAPEIEVNAGGGSLGADAWRRLRRDYAAMAALVMLALVALAAFLTPLLPLQPPDAVRTKLQYAEPTISPLWLHDFAFDASRIEATLAEAARLRAELPALEAAYDEAAAAYERAAAGLPARLSLEERDALFQPFEESRNAAFDALFRKRSAIGDAIQAPYTRAGFPELGALSRWMVRARWAVFGDRQLNSLAGRDLFGRDILSRIFWGARISLMVGLVATMVSLLIGVTCGAVAGYFGGWLDNAMMRVVDILYSIPFIFVVIFVVTVLNEDHIARRLAYYGVGKITVFYFVVGAIYWLTMARVVRGQVISLKTEAFVEAARSLGAGKRRIIFRHLLPNVSSIVLVYLTLTIPRVMLFEAFLSFLGLGVEAPDVSWGLLAKEGIEVLTPVRIYWWLVLFPSIALGTTLLALNFLGDGLRDALDPKLRDR